MDERRTHVTVEFRSKRLGMVRWPRHVRTLVSAAYRHPSTQRSNSCARHMQYLEPGDDDNRGAVLIRFEPVDNSPGEAEASGALRPGFRCVVVRVGPMSVR